MGLLKTLNFPKSLIKAAPVLMLSLLIVLDV